MESARIGARVDAGTGANLMRVALIDPSLFTLPYDAAFARALRSAGLDVTLHGRAMRPEDGAGSLPGVQADFYKISESRFVRRLPKILRLTIKGFDHVVSMRALAAQFRHGPPDIIHFQWLPLPMIDARWVRSLRRIAPVMLTVHDTDPFNGSPTAALQRAGFRKALHACDSLIVHTVQGLNRLLRMGITRSRLLLIPHGPLVDVPKSLPADDFSCNLTFTLFGKIKPYKGADLLIEAFARLPDQLRQNARIRIVGQPYMDIQTLRDLAGRLGVSPSLSLEPRFVADAELPAIFAPGTVAAFPYREIEASGVLSLALAAGRPVLASRLGSFADTLTDGVHGRLVPAGDIDALSAAMAGMIGDRASTAAYAHQATSLARLAPGWGDIAAQVVSYYEAMLVGRRSPAVSNAKADRAVPEFA